MEYEISDIPAKDMPTSALVLELVQLSPALRDAWLSRQAWPERIDYNRQFSRLDCRHNELGDELDRRVPGGAA